LERGALVWISRPAITLHELSLIERKCSPTRGKGILLIPAAECVAWRRRDCADVTAEEIAHVEKISMICGDSGTPREFIFNCRAHPFYVSAAHRIAAVRRDHCFDAIESAIFTWPIQSNRRATSRNPVGKPLIALPMRIGCTPWRHYTSMLMPSALTIEKRFLPDCATARAPNKFLLRA